MKASVYFTYRGKEYFLRAEVTPPVPAKLNCHPDDREPGEGVVLEDAQLCLVRGTHVSLLPESTTRTLAAREDFCEAVWEAIREV